MWSENADGSGAYNFHTGMGGFLQSLLYGYLGADLHDRYLTFTPQLPPSLTRMAVRGLDYRGGSLDLAFSAADMTVTLTRAGGCPLTLTLLTEGRNVRLRVGSPVTAATQPARIVPSPA